jgi:hypothetical protein
MTQHQTLPETDRLAGPSGYASFTNGLVPSFGSLALEFKEMAMCLRLSKSWSGVRAGLNITSHFKDRVIGTACQGLRGRSPIPRETVS